MITRIFIILICLGFAGCGKEAPVVEESPLPKSVVAVVGEQWIDESEIEHLVSTGGARDSAHALRVLMEQAQLAESARLSGFSELPEIRIAQRRLLAERFLENAESASAPPPVTEAMVREAYNKSGDRFQIPARAKVAVLRMEFSDQSDLEIAKSKLSEARDAYQALPEDPKRLGFGSLAIRYSDEPNTRFQGGVSGWLQKGTDHLIVPRTVVDSIFREENAGLCPEVFVAADAAWLVLIQELMPPVKRPYENVKFELRRELEDARNRAMRQTVLNQAAERAPVEVLHDLPQYQSE